MNKRIMVTIGIAVVTMSFMLGVLYEYEEYRPVEGEQWIENGELQSKFIYNFTMPVDKETAYIWLDWAISVHQYYIDNKIFTKENTLELHQAYIDMYGKVKVLFQEISE